LSITAADIVDMTDSNRILRLNISSSFNETISAGSGYTLASTVNNGTHISYNFTGLNTARLDVYET
jgi:hypothetical protein